MDLIMTESMAKIMLLLRFVLLQNTGMIFCILQDDFSKAMTQRLAHF